MLLATAISCSESSVRTFMGLFLVIRFTALCMTRASVVNLTKPDDATGTLQAGRLKVTTPMSVQAPLRCSESHSGL